MITNMTCCGYPVTVTNTVKQTLLTKLTKYHQKAPEVDQWTIGVNPATNELTTTLFHQAGDYIIGDIPYQHQNSHELQHITTVQLINYLTTQPKG